MDSKDVFLQRTKEKIDNGAYDDMMALPFMSRDKLIERIENEANDREERGHTPILTEAEILGMLKDMREAAVETAKVFLRLGILEERDGNIQLTRTGLVAVKEADKS